jgi:hypothetical protein
MRSVLKWFRPACVPPMCDRSRRSVGKPRLAIRGSRVCRSLVVAVIVAAVLPSWALGAGWKIQSTFNPTGATSATLDAVSCLSESSCLAVGGSRPNVGTAPPGRTSPSLRCHVARVWGRCPACRRLSASR